MTLHGIREYAPSGIQYRGRMAGNGVQVMHEILLPLPTYFLCLFSDIRTFLFIQFGLVLHTTTQGFRQAEELKRDLLKEYSEEYQIYMAEKISVRRSMEIGDTSVCSQDFPVLSQWSVLFNKMAAHAM